MDLKEEKIIAPENEKYAQTFEHIKELAVAMKGLYDQAYQVYSGLVNDVLHDRITQERDIERVMDGLLGYAEDERFIKLYKDLCRHVYYHYPKLVGEHVALFRAQFMESDEEEEQ